MPTVSPQRLVGLLAPYLTNARLPAGLYDQLGAYLDLLLKWNARTNLTSIQEPEEMITRHFGESLFAAAHLPLPVRSVLDLGSGAGFPGLPLQLLRPELAVTLAESQGKKAAFLREVIRTLGLPTQVHAARAEDLLGNQTFDIVTLRAVDNMPRALTLARRLATIAVLVLTTKTEAATLASKQIPMPGSKDRILAIL